MSIDGITTGVLVNVGEFVIIWNDIHCVWFNSTFDRYGEHQAEQKVKQQQQCIDKIACYYAHR